MHSHAERHGCLSKSHGASSMGYSPFLSEPPPLTPPVLKKNQTEKRNQNFPMRPGNSHRNQVRTLMLSNEKKWKKRLGIILSVWVDSGRDPGS